MRPAPDQSTEAQFLALPKLQAFLRYFAPMVPRIGSLTHWPSATGFAFFATPPTLADDSAASIAAGGFVARRETRIVMAKEVLQISPDKIVVDYDFRNDTDQDVTTEVAFPVPPYSYGPESPAISDASFSNFQLLVGGKTVTYQTEAKATLNGKDVTATLTADKIDIASFGHLREPDPASTQVQTPDVQRLPKPSSSASRNWASSMRKMAGVCGPSN